MIEETGETQCVNENLFPSSYFSSELTETEEHIICDVDSYKQI
jgi:hypothetical protein